MRIGEWVRTLADRPDFAPLLENNSESSEWQSVAPEARPVLFAAAYLKRPRKCLILTANYERCLSWEAKLRLLGVAPSTIKQLPSGTSALFEDATPEHNALSDRIGALRALVEEETCIVIAAVPAALERTLPREALDEAFIQVRPGMEIDPSRLIRQLVRLGYEPQEPVRIPGQFSQRGGILDIYATGRDLPVRIELFGDEVESIRAFDPNSQRSVGGIESLTIPPSRETIYPEQQADFRDLILDSMEREAASLNQVAAEKLRETISADADTLASGVYFDRLDLYRPLLHPDSGCAIDLLGPDDLLILDEPLELEAVASRAEEELGEALKARAERGEILRSTANDFMLPPVQMSTHGRTISLSAMNALPDWLAIANKIDVQAVSLEPYRGRAEALGLTMKTWIEQGFALVFGTDQPSRAKSVLSQVEIFTCEEFGKEQPLLTLGNLGGGFVLPEARLAVVTDAELFGVARLKLPQKRFMEGAPIATVLDLKPGDYVVHINFGIGIFRGLVKREVEGIEKEFLFIEYQAPDKLFVPADQLDRIQKYLNPGDTNPKVNRLTGVEWQKTIARAKEDAQAFARDLVKLYAQRKGVQRRPFGPDSPWQSEMESTFPWVETPSQLAAIRDVKRDMNQDFPMDRLVCGDVGFGKTEVAIRAAFKAIQAGKQVAVLCPTTILSEQHYRSFQERMGSFSVKIALLNRFRTAAEKRDILNGLKTGKVEMVIGTHSILTKSIEFKDLGLVIIDEEQKFGVKQKEVLKQLRTSVDVLTLTATPIPRTLSMALMDIRQMSLINDPPPGRLPIRTFVRPYSAEVIREAILRELARGGQVYYVYNRVESINHVAERLRKLIPHAKIGVGHGQMTESELEPVMIAFIKGEIDILLSTTIIENGLDIPNTNTLIVENADRLGLAQLYQLRGRVGRSDRQAYAYLLYQSGKELSENALARLQALQEFSSLGSGYSLAFRDLQIRGAGELLGAKQHGSMASVGYELYTRLIEEAVKALRSSVDGSIPGDSTPEDPLAGLTPLPSFDIPVPALLPESYIRDQAQRLYYYQKLMTCKSLAQLTEVAGEIEDRYGRPPAQAKNAFDIMISRILGKELHFDKLDAKSGRISVNFTNRQKISPRVFSILSQKNRECYLTRDAFIWPYTGDPLQAVNRMVTLFRLAVDEVEKARASIDA